ncbi:LysR family transcriptional regulator [Luteibacter aegosomaticola]|uniref:LysR family transcriptional regulator n=1 Tax=Luteibacter aegosomaticola TaxID=2911538 RepID=UPI001FFBA3A3|nr:LysR family transcriptional regulator [Luteibacter aegosomaticola]UPG92147.1 LysR family transcriptional regulator [Luteibacter aegosomaticola]
MDKVQEMTSFVAVVDAGSFIGAADATGVTKAAISRHVADLERRLGVRLLHRTTRRLSLTDEGRTFYGRARDLLAGIAEAEAELTARSTEPTGLLRITAPLSFGVLHLAPLWAKFTAEHAQIALDITLSDRVVDLVEEGFDLAVRISRLPNSTLVSRQLGMTRMLLCASPAYLATRGTPLVPADLASHALLAYSYWPDEWQFTTTEGKIERVAIKPLIRSNNGDTSRIAALAGQGITLQPDFIVGDDVREGRLIHLLPAHDAGSIGIHAVYASRKHLPVKVRRMVDFLADAFDGIRWS